MPDKKINELPDESGMTTADADKLIFIGDPADGKLYKGIKPVGGSIPNLQQVTDAGNTISDGSRITEQFAGQLTTKATDNSLGTSILDYGLLYDRPSGNCTLSVRNDITGGSLLYLPYLTPSDLRTLSISLTIGGITYYADANGNFNVDPLILDLQVFTSDNAAAAALPPNALYRIGNNVKIV
jgi:hypothetical protein